MEETFIFNATSKIRLDVFLRKVLPETLKCEISNSKIRRLIIAGCVCVNGRDVRVPGFTVFSASTVTVKVDKEKLLFEKQASDIKFEVTEESVLFEDDYLIFINKPSHFPTEKTIVASRDNLHDALVRYLWNKNPELRNPPYVGIMHRLDKETSGVILFTKKREVNKAIFDMFDSGKLDLENAGAHQKVDSCNSTNARNTDDSGNSTNARPVKKTYVAQVFDSPQIKDSFTVKNYLGRITSKSSQGKWGSVPKAKGGLIAVTEFKVRERKNGICILECHPVTGRTHQIRIHLAQSGFPIIGDTLYGKDAHAYNTKLLKSSPERLMLHAESLELVHPVTGERLCIKAESGF